MADETTATDVEQKLRAENARLLGQVELERKKTKQATDDAAAQARKVTELESAKQAAEHERKTAVDDLTLARSVVASQASELDNFKAATGVEEPVINDDPRVWMFRFDADKGKPEGRLFESPTELGVEEGLNPDTWFDSPDRASEHYVKSSLA